VDWRSAPLWSPAYPRRRYHSARAPEPTRFLRAAITANTAPIDTLFGLNSPLLQEILGSEFSVDPLKRAVAQKLKTPFGLGQARLDQLLKLVANKVRITSKARDISADAGVSSELKKELTKIAPGYEFPFEPQTYYCSYLALHFLELGP
jgi:hypothetical protein